MTFTPEAVLAAFGLLVQSGIFYRLGSLGTICKDNRERIIRIEGERAK